MRSYRLLQGDALTTLREIDADSVHCVVTSPPYYGLRSYGVPPTQWPAISYRPMAALPAVEIPAMTSCLGLEVTPAAFIGHLVQVFREVRRVLRDDGTCWLNLGDCYATGAGKVGSHPGGGEQGARWKGEAERHRDARRRDPSEASRAAHAGKHAETIAAVGPTTQPNRMPLPGLKGKDLIGVPWRAAFALQADGWWLRSDVIWAKPNPMPSSVRDRPTGAHEYVFLLSKSEHYFFDEVAIAEEAVSDRHKARNMRGGTSAFRGQASLRPRGKNEVAPGTLPNGSHSGRAGFNERWDKAEADGQIAPTRNRRSVWTIATQPFPGAHFATMPEALVEPCIRAGTSEKGACDSCGAPWEREVERTRTLDGEPAELPAARTTSKAEPTSGTGIGHGRIETVTKDLGWRPTCKCAGGGQIPCTVLDPFSGSGTVATVALRMGRTAIGCELNPDYVELAHKRITGDAPLLNRAAGGDGR